jgi:hypothetical protein
MYFLTPIILLILFTQVSLAQVKINWDNLRNHSVDAYQNGPGKTESALQNALKIEKKNLPSRVQQLYFGVENFNNLEARDSRNLEKGAYVQGNYIIGSWRGPMENMIEKQMAFLMRHNEMSLWHFLSEIYQNYGVLWGALIKIKHLQEDVEEAQGYLEQIKEIEQKGGVSKLVFSDIEIEVGKRRIELSQNIEIAEKSKAFLKQWLGEFSLDTENSKDLSIQNAIQIGSIDPTLLQNPWLDFANKIEYLPQIQQISAEQQTLIARGESLLVSSAPWNLQVTAQARSIAYREWWSVVTIGINIPIAYPAQAESARLKSEAMALAQEKEWTERKQRVLVESLQREYQALLDHIKRLDQHLILPAKKKRSLMDQGFKNGDIRIDEFLLNLLKQHEIEHQKLDSLIRLKLLHEQSDIWQLFLEDPKKIQKILNTNQGIQ